MSKTRVQCYTRCVSLLSDASNSDFIGESNCSFADISRTIIPLGRIVILLPNPIGIIGAMDEEIAWLLPKITKTGEYTQAGLLFHEGLLEGRPVVVVRCGIGKVNAAICTQVLIDHYNPEWLINTGVAGGIAPSIQIGDLVVSRDAVQHDFDTTVFGDPLGTIPRTNARFFTADRELAELAVSRGQGIFGEKAVHLGRIATGDQFISAGSKKQFLADTFAAHCAEMEGASIAHTAYLNKKPFVILRAISDNADDEAPTNFEQFLDSIIPKLSEVVLQMVRG